LAHSHRNWAQNIAPQIRWTAEKGRMLTGSIGAREATVIHEWQVADLADLEKCWSALGKIDAHKKWSKDMEPYVVSGSAKWEICRMV
jgi:hypothetical protein